MYDLRSIGVVAQKCWMHRPPRRITFVNLLNAHWHYGRGLAVPCVCVYSFVSLLTATTVLEYTNEGDIRAKDKEENFWHLRTDTVVRRLRLPVSYVGHVIANDKKGNLFRLLCHFEVQYRHASYRIARTGMQPHGAAQSAHLLSPFELAYNLNFRQWLVFGMRTSFAKG